MRYKSIPKTLFQTNRSRFKEKMQKNTFAVFHSNDQMPLNGDRYYPFRQNSDFFYLTGIEQEKSILTIFPDCPNKDFREILFILKPNPLLETWEGKKLDKEKARAISGINTIMWLDDFETVLHQFINISQAVYINGNENDRATIDIPSRDTRFAIKLREKYPALNFLRSAPIMKELRMLKSDIEINLIKKACKITESAFRKILKFIKPGLIEYEIEAEIIAEFIRQGANGYAYEPIIASGINSCTLHYTNNNKQCKNGEILLMDFGAEYANYASDLTRSVPVNGKFSKRQKEVYNAVLRVMKAAKKMLVPGNILEEYHKEVCKIMEKELVDLGLLSMNEIKKQDKSNPLYKKYFMHGTSHHLGLDVHDLSNKYIPFKEGMVLTCEPGIYIKEEALGIRLENDILITSEGPVDLMEDIPIEIEEIEDLMN